MGIFSPVMNRAATHPNGELFAWEPLPTGASTVTLHFDNEVNYGGTDVLFARLYESASADGSSPVEVGVQTGVFGPADMPKTWDFDVTGVTAGHYVAGFFGSSNVGSTNAVDCYYSDDLTYCAYGTRLQAGKTSLVVMTPTLLSNIVNLITRGWAWVVVSIFAGTILDVNRLCAYPRPAEPTFTAGELLELATSNTLPPSLYLEEKALTWLQWAIWPQFCECVPGSPSPVPYPTVYDPGPDGAPAGPLADFTCDNTDLCSLLQAIMLAVSSLQQQQRQTASMVTLIQRQGVPFSYVQGTTYAGLSGQGEYAVSDLLGLAVTYTTIPSTYPPISGDPLTYHQIGKISVGTADGWERSWMPTHSPYLILPISGAITKFGYAFPTGIVANITELVREP